MYSFESIPALSFDTVQLSRQNISSLEGETNEIFGIVLQRFTHAIICEKYPFVASMTLQHIDNELAVSLRRKERTLAKLKKKYNKRTRNVNVVQDIVIQDFEMSIEDNVMLIPKPHSNLLRTAPERNLITIIIKQFEAALEGKLIEKEFTNIYTLLRDACDNRFTQLEFLNSNQQTLDSVIIYRIVQVWQIFDQYFKQFNYFDYLQNYYTIKNKSDTKFVASILRILIDIGPTIQCPEL